MVLCNRHLYSTDELTTFALPGVKYENPFVLQNIKNLFAPTETLKISQITGTHQAQSSHKTCLQQSKQKNNYSHNCHTHY